jgi:hypothetical protein
MNLTLYSEDVIAERRAVRHDQNTIIAAGGGIQLHPSMDDALARDVRERPPVLPKFSEAVIFCARREQDAD